MGKSKKKKQKIKTRMNILRWFCVHHIYTHVNKSHFHQCPKYENPFTTSFSILSFTRMINITYSAIYFSFWFIIVHATGEVLPFSHSLSHSLLQPQCKPKKKKSNTGATERKKNNSNIRWTNTMSCPGTTPDVGEFPLTACEYELFDLPSRNVCLPESGSLSLVFFFFARLLPLCDNSPTEYEIFESEPL